MLLAIGLFLAVQVGDADVAALLREKGAKVTESKGVPTSVDAADCSKWTEDDFKLLGRLTHLKSLSLGAGLDDAALALLAGLQDLESFQTNLSTVSDEGVKGFAALKNLRTLKCFHPGKSFTGTGLSQLAGLPLLRSLTVAGSLAFGDEGMAAAATLTELQEFRSWHTGFTVEGVKKLAALKKLSSVTLGQRLAYAPPTSLSDETVAVLAGMKSLTTLRLEEARLTAEALLQLKQLPALAVLTLEGIEIPEADVDRVRKELANVKLTWTPPGDAYKKRIRALFGEK